MSISENVDPIPVTRGAPTWPRQTIVLVYPFSLNAVRLLENHQIPISKSNLLWLGLNPRARPAHVKSCFWNSSDERGHFVLAWSQYW